ncbi:hypothetical protein MRX96_037109 [Rhipicephalus microplus]
MRKRTHEDRCDEREQGPRKQLPMDYYPVRILDDHGNDGSQISNAPTSAQLESSADTASQLLEADDMDAPAEAEERGAAQEHVPSIPPNTAAFLRVARKKLKKKKKKSRRQHADKQPTHPDTAVASTCTTTAPRTAPAAATTTREERKVPFSNSQPLEDEGKSVATGSANHHGPTGDSADTEGFQQVFSRGARRH